MPEETFKAIQNMPQEDKLRYLGIRNRKSMRKTMDDLTLDEQIEMAESDVLSAMDYVEELKRRKEEQCHELTT